VELYLGGARESPQASSLPTCTSDQGGSGHRAEAEEDWRGRRPGGHRHRDAAAEWRRTGEGGGQAGMQADGRALLKGARGAVGRRRRPDVASQAHRGRASLTVGGRAER
jgi:hypothetical protein